MASGDGCVVVGAGLAAANVVATLREEGYTAPITLIGDEGERPYERPALSKDVLQGKAEPDSLYVHEEGWYAEHDIATRFDDAVVAVERDQQQVRLSSGDAVGYEHLVLATGASPRMLPIPGADLTGVHTLRRIPDSKTLQESFGAGRRCVVIGAGWIGLEVAAAAKAAGAEVTVLEYADLPLQRVLGDQLGSYFAELHRRNGVDLRFGVSVTAFEGTDGRVTGVRVGGADGELVPADLVVVGVGAAPNTALAEGAGIKVDNGVLVDAQLHSSDPQILAVGDVANALNSTLGERIRVEHWDNAIRQGQLAAKSVLGRTDTYDWQPYFYTDQFDLGMEYVGYGSADDDVVVRGSLDSGEFVAFWLRAGKLSAAMNVNVWDINDDLRALMGREITPERLADQAIAFSDL